MDVEGVELASEKAYAQYKLGDIDAAKSKLNAFAIAEDDTLFSASLKAQIAFRTGDFAGCKKEYEGIRFIQRKHERKKINRVKSEKVKRILEGLE